MKSMRVHLAVWLPVLLAGSMALAAKKPVTLDTITAERRGGDSGGTPVWAPDGKRFAYDQLILATGSRARPLPIPGADLNGVLFLRSAAHAETLKAALGPALANYPGSPPAAATRRGRLPTGCRR